MFAAPAENPQDFDPRFDDCVYARFADGKWTMCYRVNAKWSTAKTVTNMRWNGLELARGSGLVPPGVPVFWHMPAEEWRKHMDALPFSLTYEQAIS